MTNVPSIYTNIRADWEIFQGDYVNVLIRFGTEDAPILTTNKTYRMMVKKRFGDTSSEAVLNLTTENGGIVYDGNDGIRIIIQASATENLRMPRVVNRSSVPTLDYVYDLEEILDLTKPTKILVGSFVIVGEVTN